jgi:hypothetical protein
MRHTIDSRIRKVYQKIVPAVVRGQIYALRQEWPPKIDFREHAIDFRNRATQLLDGSVRNMSSRMRSLQGKYHGQRCFVMGNGPSLNCMELELFQREHVWGSNRCYLLFDKISWKPGFYTAVDTRVVPDIAHDIKRLTYSLPQTRFNFPVQFREQRVLRSAPNVVSRTHCDCDCTATGSLSGV